MLNIVDAASAPVPNTFPSGLVFRSSGSQNVSVYSSTDQTAPYQVAVSTDNGAGWLSAYNALMPGGNISGDARLDDTMLWLDRYCLDHPFDAIQNGLFEFNSKIAPDLMRST